MTEQPEKNFHRHFHAAVRELACDPEKFSQRIDGIDERIKLRTISVEIGRQMLLDELRFQRKTFARAGELTDQKVRREILALLDRGIELIYGVAAASSIDLLSHQDEPGSIKSDGGSLGR